MDDFEEWLESNYPWVRDDQDADLTEEEVQADLDQWRQSLDWDLDDYDQH